MKARSTPRNRSGYSSSRNRAENSGVTSMATHCTGMPPWATPSHGPAPMLWPHTLSGLSLRRGLSSIPAMDLNHVTVR